MSKYFEKFPKMLYDIQGKRRTNYETVTNIFFRMQIIRSLMGNINAYYDYLIKDDDTPEILADKVYGDIEAHWIILMSNDMVDPQYDWPLKYLDFNKYIINKYGSIASAKTTYHHYEKVVSREESASGTIVETRFFINQANSTSNLSSSFVNVPYDTYNSLTETQDVDTINMGSGKTVIEITKRDAITNYDYEEQMNDKKRAIKLIKPEYYSQIIREFDTLARTKERSSYLRRLF